MDQLSIDSGQRRQAEETAEIIAECLEPAALRIRNELRGLLQSGLDRTREHLQAHVAGDVAAAVARLPLARDGRDGRDGTDGVDGKEACLRLARAWCEGMAYAAGELVTHRNGLWQASADTNQPPPDSDWRCVACGVITVSGSVDAEDGRLFTLSLELSTGDVINLEHRIAFPIHRGTWEHGRTYPEADEVGWLGCTWRAARETATEPPGADWRLVSKAGERGGKGKAGPIGPQGEPGMNGRDGRDGKTPSVNAVRDLVLGEIAPRLAALEAAVAGLRAAA